MDARTRRRCAALAVFEPLLGESELIDALWLCEDRMGGESVTDILRYVDLVGERHGIDAGTRKRLYGALHAALRLDVHDLPLDPWPAMAASRPDTARAATPWPPQAAAGPTGRPEAAPTAVNARPGVSPVPRPAGIGATWGGSLPATAWPGTAYGLGPAIGLPTAPHGPAPRESAAGPVAPTTGDVAGPTAGPVATPTAAPTAAPAPAPSAPPATQVTPPSPAVAAALPPATSGRTTDDATADPLADDDPTVPAVQRVFADIVDALHAEVSLAHGPALDDWVQACAAQLGAPLQDTPGRAALASLGTGVDRAQRRQAWRLTRSTADLSALLTGLYVSLCEALGPVAADQVLGRAVRAAEQRPAAREFAPRRLL